MTKAEMMAQAEESIAKLMEWETNHERPTLAAIEAIVLEVGKEWERKMAQGVISRQEEVRPSARASLCEVRTRDEV
jgi:hypothetical protein